MGRQRQLIQKQLTSIMLIQIPIILLATVPYNRIAAELVITNTLLITSYLPFACPFIIFFVSSEPYRKEAKRVVFCWKNNTLKRTNNLPYPVKKMRNTQFPPSKTSEISFNSIAILTSI
ncbi:unnamed protein product [Rotaria magnacalcarata]